MQARKSLNVGLSLGSAAVVQTQVQQLLQQPKITNPLYQKNPLYIVQQQQVKKKKENAKTTSTHTNWLYDISHRSSHRSQR